MSVDIVLVDDDREIRFLFEAILDSEGYEVASFARAEPALEFLREGARPRMFIIDLMMPGIDGREFRKRQLDISESSDIPFMLVTGVTDLEGDLHAPEPCAIIQKPITDLEDFVGEIRACLSEFDHG